MSHVGWKEKCIEGVSEGNSNLRSKKEDLD
jgi:hypothetical protein